jgi:hypothetical protein
MWTDAETSKSARAVNAHKKPAANPIAMCIGVFMVLSLA